MKKKQSFISNPPILAHRCSYHYQTNNMCDCPAVNSANKIKYLGIIINDTLSFRPHIEALSNKIRKLIFIFKQLRNVAGLDLIMQVYYALCQSLLTYCITSWGGAAKTLLLNVERAQRAILKVSTFRPYLYPTNLLYKTCNVLTVRQLFIFNTVLKQHKALPYSKDITDKRRKDIVCNQLTDTKHPFATKFFAYLGPRLYNKLNAITCIYHLNLFECKKALQKILEKLSYDDTEKLLTVPK